MPQLWYNGTITEGNIMKKLTYAVVLSIGMATPVQANQLLGSLLSSLLSSVLTQSENLSVSSRTQTDISYNINGTQIKVNLDSLYGGSSYSRRSNTDSYWYGNNRNHYSNYESRPVETRYYYRDVPNRSLEEYESYTDDSYYERVSYDNIERLENHSYDQPGNDFINGVIGWIGGDSKKSAKVLEEEDVNSSKKSEDTTVTTSEKEVCDSEGNCETMVTKEIKRVEREQLYRSLVELD